MVTFQAEKCHSFPYIFQYLPFGRAFSNAIFVKNTGIMSKVYIYLAEGFEETEALATLDVLRRAGLDVVTVSIDEKEYVTGSHGVTVRAEQPYSSINVVKDDVMVFPGGMPGTKNLAQHQGLMETMCRHYAEGGRVAAICAAPGLVLSQLPDIKGERLTCFDGFETSIIEKGAEYVKAPSVISGNIVTGRGAGCAVDFGLSIVTLVCGGDVAAQVKASLML